MELNSAFGYFWGGVVFGPGNFWVFKENPRAFLVLIFAPFYHPLTSNLEYPMGIKDIWGGGGCGVETFQTKLHVPQNSLLLSLIIETML